MPTLWIACLIFSQSVIAAPLLDDVIKATKDLFGAPTKETILEKLSSTPVLDDKGIGEMKQSTVLSAIAYCDASAISSWNCKPCQLSEASGITNAQVFSSDSSSVQGYVAVNEQTSNIIVSFRGTNNFINAINNVQVELVPSSELFNSSCIQVHQGFLSNYLSIRDQFKTLLEDAANKHPSFNIIMTGHSLGAALATLAGVDTVRNADISGSRVRLSTIGEPRIGNSKFVDAVKECQFSSLQRGVNKADIVPHMPLSSISPYRHRPGELWTSFDDKTYVCRDNDEEDENCSATLPLVLLNQEDHLYYFGVAATCS